MKQRLALIIQFLLAVFIGGAAFYGLSIDQAKAPLLGGLLAGFFGQWLVMKLYVLVRFGWHACKTMQLYGNEDWP